MAGTVSTITIGTVDHDVYAFTADAVQDADDYFAARLDAAAWTGATTLQKQQALITAARRMDARASFSGTKTSDSQPRAWPRDSASCNGTAITDGTIPDAVVWGQFELGLALLKSATVLDNPTTGSNIKRVAAGPAQVEFFNPTAPSDATQFPQAVHELIGCLLASASILGAPFIDGTDEDEVDERSAFDTCTDRYNLNDGFA